MSSVGCFLPVKFASISEVHGIGISSMSLYKPLQSSTVTLSWSNKEQVDMSTGVRNDATT